MSRGRGATTVPGQRAVRWHRAEALTVADRARRYALRILLLALPCVAGAVPPQQVDHGRFEQVPVQRPDGAVQRVVIWFHGEGRAAAAAPVRDALRRDGALVVPVDIGRLRAALAREGAGDCAFGSGDVENFSRWLQAFLRLPGYRLPVLAGDGEGALLAHALAAQAGAGVFAGLLTTDACPAPAPQRLACAAGTAGDPPRAAPLRQPWLDAGSGQHCAALDIAALVHDTPMARSVRRTSAGEAAPALVAAARVLGAAAGTSIAPAPRDLSGLPVIEVPAARAGDTLAIFMSGDGGWAGLDKDVAAALAARGVAVVGVDSLRYFWTARTPAGVAVDLGRIAEHYRQHWQRPRLLLIGFSQGADVLPASVNEMDPALRSQVALIALLSVGRRADFEFHVSNWLGGGGDGRPIAPDLLRLPAAKLLCLYGERDADALCPQLPAGAIRVRGLPGDHHFNGDHDRLAEEILEAAGLAAGGR